MDEKLFDLTGKVAIVTGGASGLGRRIAQTLASVGVSVAVADLNIIGAQEVARAINERGGSAIAHKLDVTSTTEVHNSVREVISTFKRLDIGVNAAGVAGGRPEDETMPDIWNHIINVDLNGVYYCCLEYANIMKEQRSGKIINVASMSASIVNNFPQPPVDESRLFGLPAYCAAKAGVKQLTKVFAAQWAEYGIRVNSISPGYMETEMTREIFGMPEVIKKIVEETPLRRVGQPDDLDGLIIYMASNASDFLTGSDVVIDGGYTIW